MLQIQGQIQWAGRSVTIGSTQENPNLTLREQEVRSSNLRAPTNTFNKLQGNRSPAEFPCQHSVNAMAQLALRRVTRPPCS